MPRSTSRRQETPALDRRILMAAVGLFARKGFAATSTREIAEAAEVTKPMIYYYFQSKEGLCRAALTHFLDEFREQLRATVEDSRPSGEAYLSEVVWVYLDFCRQHRDFARLFYATWFGPDEQTPGVDLGEATESSQQLLLRAVQRATREGLIARSRQDRFLMALNGMINIWVMAAIKQDAPLTRDLARQVVRDLLRGYGRPS